jgi:hypothetical protein
MTWTIPTLNHYMSLNNLHLFWKEIKLLQKSQVWFRIRLKRNYYREYGHIITKRNGQYTNPQESNVRMHKLHNEELHQIFLLLSSHERWQREGK